METSFKDIDVEATETKPGEIAAAPKEQSAALTAPTTGAVSVPRESDDFFSNEGFEGEANDNAIEVPRLVLVHGVGDLSAKFEAGSIVLNGEKKLTIPLEITPFRVRNFVREYIPFNDDSRKDDIPRVFKNADEARAAGFVFAWERDRDDTEAKTCENAATVDVLVKGTPELADICPFDIDGVPYLPARLFVKGKQHRLIYNKLYTQSTFSKGAHPATFRWKLSTKRGKEGSNWVWRMNIELCGKNTPEQVQKIRDIVG